MKISTKGEYGIRAMLYVAMHTDELPVTSHEIATHQGIPEPYLRQILAALARGGLIQSNRGPQGGHVLGRPSRDISVKDVLVALEGHTTSVDQILAQPCTIDIGPEHCVIREVFLEVKAAVENILDGTNLHDLAMRQQEILRCDIQVPLDLPSGRSLPVLGPEASPAAHKPRPARV